MNRPLLAVPLIFKHMFLYISLVEDYIRIAGERVEIV